MRFAPKHLFCHSRESGNPGPITWHLYNSHIVQFIMFKDVDRVIEEALELPPEDRLRLADRMYESVPKDEVVQAWLDEAERRAADMDTGVVQGIDLEDVLKEARERMRK